MRIDWSPSAVADLKTIAEWIEQDRDLETANRIARAIYDAVQSLRSMPYRAATAGWKTPAFRTGGEDCTGRLVLGTSPGIGNPWAGRLRGLAIYRGELSAEQAVRHHRTWTASGRPKLSKDEWCAALYLFDERSGRVVHNHSGPGPDLVMPERYRVLDQAFLTPFWQIPLDLPDMLRNVAAFLPLGFFLSGWSAAGRLSRRPVLIAVVAGGLLSLTIEVLQFWLPTRQSDMTDLLTNTMGAWAGAMVYCRSATLPGSQKTQEPTKRCLTA